MNRLATPSSNGQYHATDADERREREFFASLLYRPEQFVTVADALKVEDLTQHPYRMLWAAMRRLHAGGTVPTLSAVSDAMAGELKDFWVMGEGGHLALAYLHGVGEESGSADTYVPRILDRAKQLRDGGHGSSSRWPDPVPLPGLPDDDAAPDWIWQDYIPPGHLLLFTALMKAGKSTFLGHMFRALQGGRDFCGRPTRKCRTLVVSEESRRKWRDRREALGLDGSVAVMVKPMIAKPNLADWTDFVAHLAIVSDGYDLVVFDTISAFAPWKDENAAAEMQAAVTPLNRLTNQGTAVMLVHHSGKADQSEGKAARGSTALAAAVDVILEMRRFRPDDLTDRRRVLTGLGRFEEIPHEVVVRLREDGGGYDAEGDRRQTKARELFDLIDAILPEVPPGMKIDDVHAQLPEDDRPSRGDVSQAFQHGVEVGKWATEGNGKKGSPKRFWK